MPRLRAALVVLAAAALVGLAFASGLVAHVTDQERLRSTVDGVGIWGPVLFLVLMVVFVPLNVPGVVFVLPATTVFGLAGGIALSLVGGFTASVIGMVVARRLGRTFVETRLPARLRRWEQRLAHRGFWAVVGLRSVTFLFQPVDWLCGLSGIPMRTAMAGTFVGLIPPTVLISVTGGSLLDAIG